MLSGLLSHVFLSAFVFLLRKLDTLGIFSAILYKVFFFFFWGGVGLGGGGCDCVPAHQSPSEKGVYSKGEDSLPRGTNSFLLEQIPFQKETITILKDLPPP